MAIDKKQLRELIKETLKEIDLYSEDAVNLLMGTAAQESHLGTYIRQLGSGPALGIFQMEPSTFKDIMINYLYFKPELLKKILHSCKQSMITPIDIVWNLKLAICFARLQYYRRPEPLPTTKGGYAAYWKQFYNTHLGKGTEQEFINNYDLYVL